MGGNYLLLTGAGFTKNFGAPLATEFKKFVLFDIKNDKEILKVWSKHSNFEDAYVAVMTSNLSPDQKKLAHSSLMNAFSTHLNKSFEHKIYNQSLDLFRREFIEFFFKKQKLLYFFTLNQDNFIEHISSKFGDIEFNIPGVEFNDPNDIHIFSNPFVRWGIISSNAAEKSEKYLSRIKRNNGKNLIYIKLHGSSKWRTENTRILVVGADKEKSIKTYPILNHYSNVFCEQLSVKNSKILIIGYSFSDAHINQMLKKSYLENELEIYLMYPTYQEIENKINDIGITAAGFYNVIDCLDYENFHVSSELKRFQSDFFN